MIDGARLTLFAGQFYLVFKTRSFEPGQSPLLIRRFLVFQHPVEKGFAQGSGLVDVFAKNAVTTPVFVAFAGYVLGPGCLKGRRTSTVPSET